MQDSIEDEGRDVNFHFGVKGMYCKQCGVIGKPKNEVKGNFALEVLAWLGGLILGLFTLGVGFIIGPAYSCHRIFSRRTKICRSCGAAAMVPLDSPVAKEARRAKQKPITQASNSDWQGGIGTPLMPAKKPAIIKSAKQPNDSVADELTKLAKLRQSGLLTNEEFIQQKKKLMSA